ncbi:MAG: sulfotransferase family protein [Nocardioidaceae bacterium]
MLPTFLVIGAMKAGTTSLHQYLAAHPQVFMAPGKELHFFVEGLTGAPGRAGGWEKGWDWYAQQFQDAGGALAVGESSPSYTAYPLRTGVPARMARGIPDARFIYLMRNPFERARSEYVHKRLNGVERRSITSALLDDPAYLDKSRYAMQIEQYLAHFPSDRLLPVLSEDLRSDRSATMARIWRFIGVDPLADCRVLDREFHRNEDKEAASTRKQLARRLPGYTAVARRSPRLVQDVFRAVTRVRHDPRSVTVPDDTLCEMKRRLQPDLERLCEMLPTAVERWGL